MADATWKVYFDFDRDGDFDQAIEDVSDYVMSLKTQVGTRKTYQLVGDESKLTLEMDNSDKRFSPEVSTGPYFGSLEPHIKVKVDSIYNGSTVTQYTGWLQNIDPRTKDAQNLTSTVRAVGAHHFLNHPDNEVYLDLMTSTTADLVIQAILEQVQFPAALGQSWLLGVAGNSNLGNNTYLVDTSTGFSLQTGKEIFPFVGDNWDDGVKPLRAISDVVEAERGRFFFDRAGVATFWNREHLQTGTIVAGTLEDVFVNSRYSYGANVRNDVRVTVYPRTVSGGSVDLWELTPDEEVKIRRGESKSFRARYADDGSGARVGGRDLVTPNTGDGSLVLSKGNVNVTVDAQARSANITLEQSGDKNAKLTTLILRGTAISTFDAVEVAQIDGVSRAKYGRLPLKINAKALSSEQQATNIAAYEIARRKDPRGEFSQITLANDDGTQLSNMLNWTVGDRINVIEQQTGHNADYFIIGVEHNIPMYALTHHHTTTFFLERAEAFDFFLLGVVGNAEIGTATKLGL